MKNFLILITMLLTFGYTNAQSFLYHKSQDGSYSTIGKYEKGFYYLKSGNNYKLVGKYDRCKVYKIDKSQDSGYTCIGRYDEGYIYKPGTYDYDNILKYIDGYVYLKVDHRGNFELIGKADSEEAASGFLFLH